MVDSLNQEVVTQCILLLNTLLKRCTSEKIKQGIFNLADHTGNNKYW